MTSAIEYATVLDTNVVRAMTFSDMVEKAGAAELAPESMEQAQEFIRLLASSLCHVTRAHLDLIGAVKREHEAR